MSYINYGKNDLSEMNKEQLLSELKKVERDIVELQDEVENNKNVPRFAIKERLETAQWYREKVMKAIENLEINTKKECVAIDNMIKDLDRKLERGLITEDYHDRYVNKLISRKSLYLENTMHEEAEKSIEEENNKRKEKFRHPFKVFKKRLTDYRNM